MNVTAGFSRYTIFQSSQQWYWVLVVDYITLHHSRETVFPQICHNNLKIDINYKNEKRENNEKRIGEYPGLYYTEGVLLNGRRILKQSAHTIIAILS